MECLLRYYGCLVSNFCRTDLCCGPTQVSEVFQKAFVGRRCILHFLHVFHGLFSITDISDSRYGANDKVTHNIGAYLPGLLQGGSDLDSCMDRNIQE